MGTFRTLIADTRKDTEVGLKEWEPFYSFLSNVPRVFRSIAIVQFRDLFGNRRVWEEPAIEPLCKAERVPARVVSASRRSAECAPRGNESLNLAGFQRVVSSIQEREPIFGKRYNRCIQQPVSATFLNRLLGGVLPLVIEISLLVGVSRAQIARDLRLVPAGENHPLRLSWLGEDGAAFDVLRSETPIGPWWVANSSPIVSDDLFFEFVEAASRPTGFYRLKSLATEHAQRSVWPDFMSDTIYYGVYWVDRDVPIPPGDSGRLMVLYFNDRRERFEKRIDLTVDAVEVASGHRIRLIEKSFKLFLHRVGQRKDYGYYRENDEVVLDISGYGTKDPPNSPYADKFFNFDIPGAAASGRYHFEVSTTDRNTGDEIGVSYINTYSRLFIAMPRLGLRLEARSVPETKLLSPNSRTKIKIKAFNEGNVAIDTTVMARVYLTRLGVGEGSPAISNESTFIHEESWALKIDRETSKALDLNIRLPSSLPDSPFRAIVEVEFADDVAVPVDPASTLWILYPTVFTALD